LGLVAEASRIGDRTFSAKIDGEIFVGEEKALFCLTLPSRTSTINCTAQTVFHTKTEPADSMFLWSPDWRTKSCGFWLEF